MKAFKRILVIVIAIIACVVNVHAKSLHDETTTFKVYGNCNMCKNRIETALLKNQNIKKASWDAKSKMLTVIYDPHLISLDTINKIIADAGHDTDKAKAGDTVYNSLPGCCHYERKK
jgi:mercuric ion binding protein